MYTVFMYVGIEVGMYICRYVQGGALNRGLFFADPPPSLLGTVSGKISEIR